MKGYEKLQEIALRTKRAVMNCTFAMDIYCLISYGRRKFFKLQTEKTGNFLCVKIEVFISNCSTKVGLQASNYIFLISCTRQVQ